MGELTAIVDTSVLIGALGVVDHSQHGTWGVSVVTIGELHTGVLLAPHGATQSARLKRLASVLSEAPVLGVSRSVAGAYSDLRMVSERSPSNDLWIAATALANDLELVTMDKAQASLPLIRATLI